MTTYRDQLRALDDGGKAMWIESLRGWLARPEDVVEALARMGFHEYRREVARRPNDHRTLGGLWQGLEPATGAAASVIWVERFADGGCLVFVDVDGDLVQGVAPLSRDQRVTALAVRAPAA